MHKVEDIDLLGVDKVGIIFWDDTVVWSNTETEEII